MARTHAFPTQKAYLVPEAAGLGVHLTLDLGGQARFGPNVRWIDEIEYSVPPHDADSFYDEVRRYWPGLAVVDAEEGEVMPNRSGIEMYFEVPGTDASESSRRDGTATFDDMEELAIDFATAIQIIENPPVPVDATSEAGDNLTVQLVNHAFHIQNRSFKDPLVKPYRPSSATWTTSGPEGGGSLL